MVTNSRRKQLSFCWEILRRMYRWVWIGSSCHSRRNSRANLVGFWLHYVDPRRKRIGSRQPGCSRKSIQGHQHYVEEISPDFVKIMSDGFLPGYPSALYWERLWSIRELAIFNRLGEHHPWIEKQIEVVKEIRSHFHERDRFFLYNIFSPISYLKRWFRTDQSRGDQVIADFIGRRSRNFGSCSDVIAGDISFFVAAWSKGRYWRYCIFKPSRSKMSVWQMKNTASSLELPALACCPRSSHEAGVVHNILHICGSLKASNEAEPSAIIQLKSLTAVPIMKAQPSRRS